MIYNLFLSNLIDQITTTMVNDLMHARFMKIHECNIHVIMAYINKVLLDLRYNEVSTCFVFV